MEKNSSNLRLCVFPSDPIQAYYDKGEIKERYFNPNNLFSEIHVISTVENDIESSKVKEIAGNGKLFIYPIGKINLKNFRKEKNTVIQKVREIKPNLIRAYNPLIQGWLAAKCAEELNIPYILSLHLNYDTDLHSFSLKQRGLFHFLKMQYTSKNIEPYVLKSASRVICVHNSVANYARRLEAKKIDVIYNRVSLEQFSPNTKKNIHFDKPVIIYVARLTHSKNQECLIRAIKDLDVILLLVGDGPDFEFLNNLAISLKCKDKIKFVRSVPNTEIPKYYASADIFAASVKDRGIGIPFLEAMATGLPTVLRKIPGEHEELEDAAFMVENNPKDFSHAFKRILSDNSFREELKRKSLEMAKKMDGKIMENKEAQLYLEVLRTQDR